MSDLKKGDVVQLNSGGPYMTISNIGNYTMAAGIQNGAYCVWFDGMKQNGQVFDLEVLKKVEQPTS